MPSLSWARAAAWRARRHYLDRRAPAGSMLDVASRLCGLHAQVLSSAELTVWARVENLDRRAVQQALWDERTLVKTWAMRGTLHLLPASELHVWHGALGTSTRYRRPAGWMKYYGITLKQLDQVTDAIAAALEGQVLTREELAAEVKRRTRSAALAKKLAASSWGSMLQPAAFAGRLCFGPSAGQRVRFTHPRSWLSGQADAVDGQAATVDVTRRFLRAYGPATHLDLARWWNGGGLTLARQWIGALGDEVCAVDVEGTPAWMLAEDAREAREFAPGRSVRLLPGFDQYVVAASPHADQLLPADGLRPRVYRPQGWISPVLLVNGRMEGTWRHQIKGSAVDVVVEPFVQQPQWVRRAAEREAERLAAFFGANSSCRIS